MVPKVSNVSQMLLAIPSNDNRMRYSFDTIDIKSIYDKIKTLDRDFKIERDFDPRTLANEGKEKQFFC